MDRVNMEKEKTEDFALMAELESFFSALSDSTRLRIVMFLLKNGEASVQEICKRVGKSQPLVSHHMACLKNCGVVKWERKGKNVIYKLNDEHVKEIINEALNHVSLFSNSILSCEIIKEEREDGKE
ncbi:hypothetical protein IC006_0426 [Sulfuracidifex tepidarius]|uniref:HTH arsR-type domain-containing protein n=3 Tax=Sulfuracidifex tepidarius TaxID=1294262 RepID=A0A510DSI3_9CREN|nr:hypothetical protein IC006_0426 [Sulfuracidifex tepidarius]BBG25891.1 hypothetical protein IC007_0396 [Sulfuracidifex tepidarius]